MKKIIFLHGFFASGQCPLALTLRQGMADQATVLSPDLPMCPQKAIEEVRSLCQQEHPDLLVGNSCGAFYAQQISLSTGIPALLGNPYFLMTEFLRPRLGAHQYKSPRRDGRQDFVIDEALLSDFEIMEQHQFDNYKSSHQNQIWGLFGENDSLAHFEPLFLHYYTQSFHFPGHHTPTAEEVLQWYVPLAQKMLATHF